MKKKLLFCFVLYFLVSRLIAQENNKALDIGLSYKFYQENPSINVQLGYSWKLKEQFFYKISFYGGYNNDELREPERFWTNNILSLEGYTWNNIEIGISLQGNIEIITSEKVLFYGGWQTGYQFITNRSASITYDPFSETIKRHILSIRGGMGINWILENDFYCNIEMSIYIGQMQLESYRMDNHFFFSEEERTTTNFNFDLGIRTMAKIGVGTYF